MQIPLEGHPLHTRSLSVNVTRRDDGRWRARGDVIREAREHVVPAPQAELPVFFPLGDTGKPFIALP